VEWLKVKALSSSPSTKKKKGEGVVFDTMAWKISVIKWTLYRDLKKKRSEFCRNMGQNHCRKRQQLMQRPEVGTRLRVVENTAQLPVWLKGSGAWMNQNKPKQLCRKHRLGLHRLTIIMKSQ
jgi:hypothetical protein